jgi:hypothetical protein
MQVTNGENCKYNTQYMYIFTRTDTTHSATHTHMSHIGSYWLHLAEHANAAHQKHTHEEEERMQFISRLTYSLDPMRNQYRNNGDERVAQIMRYLDCFGVTRTETQQLFHFWFVQSILELVYGNEWDSSATRVLESFGLQRTWTEVMIMTPRRFGKTYSVAMFVTAVMLNVPGDVI